MNRFDRRPVEILLVEDNPGDVRLIKQALKLYKMQNTIHVAADGTIAMDFLLKRGRYQNKPKPDLILLDLNLPKKDGIEVLEDIKKDPSLRHIPVVILTSSQAEEDIIKTYQNHANCYLTKPVDLDRFLEIMKSVESFWFKTVKLPPNQ